jgi:Rhodopirellula transposase DDE domain
MEFRQNSSPQISQRVSRQQVADLRLAAAQMTGAKRRAFQAEMVEQYCAGNARQAERLFGWGRKTIEVGLAERRTGLTCLGAQSVCSGRPRWEDQQPQAAAALCSLAEAHAQQDPTFRTPLAYTRLTAQAAVAALRAQGFLPEHVPAPSTMANVLNRLGFRLRKVLKAKPQKKLAQTDAIFENIKKKMPKP